MSFLNPLKNVFDNVFFLVLSADQLQRVGLYLEHPGANGAGGVEVSGAGYAKQSVTWTQTAPGQVQNANDIEFGLAEADWGTVNHVTLHNDGDPEAWAVAEISPRTITDGGVLEIPAGTLTVQLLDFPG